MTLLLGGCREVPAGIGIVWNNDLVLPSLDGKTENPGVAGVFSGFVSGKLIVAGGANFSAGYPWEGGAKTWWRTLYVYDLQGETWKIYEDFLDEPCGYGISVQLPEGVLCIGGNNAIQCFDRVMLICAEGDSLVKKPWPSLPVPLGNAAGTILDGRIYVAGGQERMDEQSSTDHFFMLDTRSETPAWVALPSWPGPTRGYAVCTAQAGKIWLFGGRSYGPGLETTAHSDGYCYDPAANAWTKLEGSFPFMASANTTEGEEYILFLGGVAEDLPPGGPDHPGFTRKVHIFNTSTGSLDSLTTAPVELPLTTNTVRTAHGFYITSGEVRPGVRTPHITQGEINHTK